MSEKNPSRGCPKFDLALRRVWDGARRFATEAGGDCNTAHLLMALAAVRNPAQNILLDRGLDESEIAVHLAIMGPHQEVGDLFKVIEQRALHLAQQSGSQHINVLHLMIVLSNLRESIAFRLLGAAGLDPGSVRSVALALSMSRPRPGATEEETPAESEVVPPRPAQPASPTDGDAPDERALTPRQKRREILYADPRITRGKKGGAATTARPSTFNLTKENFPTLFALGRNLTEAARRGEIEPLIGRREIIDQILDTLGRRRANNPCLVGEPGVGKTAIVEGLAHLQVHRPDSVPLLHDRALIELNMGRLLSGTQLRGAFSERMAALRAEVAAASGNIIVFLDEIHTLVGAGAVGDNALDAVTELSTAMGEGKFPCIGATTTSHFKRYIESTPALHRRLQPLLVSEPTPEETLQILEGINPAYCAHHHVHYAGEALDAAVRLSGRYIADRFLPDKAIGLIDLAGSRARRSGKKQVTRQDVAELVAASTDIPVDRLLQTDSARLLNMEQFISRKIVSHSEIIGRVAQVIRRNYAGFSSHRPIGSFLFLGPTGVGKTELVKALADFLFQSPDAVCRFDMSEFGEPHNVARLIGSPPGYVGHDDGGQMTESIRRRPYQIILLDEVEKAHRDVLQILLQILDDGRLTDGRGRTADFSNTVIVLTSNLGSAHYQNRSSIGFGPANGNGAANWPEIEQSVLDTARGAFPIELWNRIEERLVFRPLSREHTHGIARLLVEDSSRRLLKAKGISFQTSESVLEHLIDHGGYDPLLGARPMRTTIQRVLETIIAEAIIRSDAHRGDSLSVELVNGELVVHTLDRAREPAEQLDMLSQ